VADGEEDRVSLSAKAAQTAEALLYVSERTTKTFLKTPWT